MAIPFPTIDPVAIHLGPLKIYWYAIAYITGIVGGLSYAKAMLRCFPLYQGTSRPPLTPDLLERYAYGSLVFGIILGGRLGHVVFYEPLYFLNNPLEIFMTWKGGMSFHGGLIGVLVASFIFIKKHNLRFFALMDMAAIATPIGLCLGRLTNFINAELYGRITESPLGIVFPGAGLLPRHPTQLYEAIFEGAILFIILGFCFRINTIRLKTGSISGLFLLFYGAFRFVIEFFKDPEAQGSTTNAILTHGHLLCLPMILGGLIIFYLSQKQTIDAISKKTC